MKIASVLFVATIALVNVVAGFWQAWVLFRKKIHVGNGVIVSSRLEQGEEWHDGNKLVMYWPLVEFEYEAAGRMMRSDRISFGSSKTSNRSVVEKRVRFYQEGRNMKVFYNPDDPSEAWLKNPRKHVWTFLCWAFGMIVFGVVFGVMLWKFVD
jgi:Protein of unknown function (DUF3592)